MMIEIKNTSNNKEATLEIVSNSLRWSVTSDEDIITFAQQYWKEGVDVVRDAYNHKTHASNIVTRKIHNNDPHFELAFIEFLKEHGYEVRVRNLEDEAEIKTLLEVIPDDNENKKHILQRLSVMSRLEQTFLLKQLRQLIKKKE